MQVAAFAFLGQLGVVQHAPLSGGSRIDLAGPSLDQDTATRHDAIGITELRGQQRAADDHRGHHGRNETSSHVVYLL